MSKKNWLQNELSLVFQLYCIDEQESVPFHCIVKHLSVLLIRNIVFWCCVMGVLCLHGAHSAW